MRRGGFDLTYFNRDAETIKRLQRDLDEARRTIIDLMPEELHDLLRSYHRCESRQETYTWERTTVDKIIEISVVKSRSPYSQPRAYCPLCRGGTNTPYADGFTVPEGLRRHLTGYGNTHHCPVTEAVFNLAGDYWDRCFKEAEEAERARAQQVKAERLKNETLYSISPFDEPVLLDHRLYGDRARTDEEMSQADERLRSLGFTIRLDGRVKTYSREEEQYIVYADPRVAGRITFTVCRKPLPKRPDKVKNAWRHYTTFAMQDSWRHELVSKYEERVASAVSELDKR